MKIDSTLILILLVVFISCKKTYKNQEKIQTMSISSDSIALPVASQEKIETIIYDLNNDNNADTINLTTPPEKGDPGEFQKIIISFSGTE